MDFINIISKILKGKDREKFSKTLFNEISPKIYFACSRYIKNALEKDEVFQESMIKIFENLNKFDPKKGDFIGWAYRISTNTAITHLKKQIKFNRNEELNEGINNHNSLETLNTFSNQELLEIINLLPEKQLLVFNLYFVDGYSHKEISKMLNIDEGTSRSNYYKARMNLKKIYKMH